MPADFLRREACGSEKYTLLESMGTRLPGNPALLFVSVCNLAMNPLAFEVRYRFKEVAEHKISDLKHVMTARAESPGPIRVDKHGRGPPLAAPVRRIFYLSAEGTMREHEVFPPPNPRLLTQVDTADALVYGMGSLYTSICPSLVLKVSLADDLPTTASYQSLQCIVCVCLYREYCSWIEKAGRGDTLRDPT